MNSPKHFSRREMLEMAAALGSLAITQPFNSVLAQGLKRETTPMQTMGPFYPIMRPLDHDMDLTVIKGKRGHAQGKLVHLTGRVLNSKGEPIRGAKIEVWQANTHGRYAHPTDINPAPLDPNFQGFGTQITDAEGRYRFKTIKPGAYPINPVNPGNVRPPHIHFDVLGKKDRLVTQMYFPNEPLNEGDIIFKELGPGQDAAIGKVLPPTKDLESESLLIHWDIILEMG
jgi:protocatechuate 3,4-dioxygenase beta subunit